MEKIKTLTTRPAMNTDSSQIKQLIFSILAEYGLCPDPLGIDADLDSIEESYALRGGLFEVLTNSDGVIVGSYALYPLDNTTCELRKMYFSKMIRGHGLGRATVQYLVKIAKQQGFSRMVLETASALKEAIHLYQKLGFQPYYPEHLTRRCDQAYSLDFLNFKER